MLDNQRLRANRRLAEIDQEFRKAWHRLETCKTNLDILTCITGNMTGMRPTRRTKEIADQRILQTLDAINALEEQIHDLCQLTHTEE
ncbi:hypothetical protein [Winkia neuii]|uniref:hypothetical protein n=1 Tax=Winkia neuii TaxID=33007 RepID=UPI0025548A57|nr:hypothetical protein [Winkia neuii]MDK8099847.1 hypothetical protein [Winkia neuii]